MLITAIVIGQVSYYTPLLGSNKERTRSTQTLVNSRLYWIEGFSNGNSFTSLYCVSKKLNILPLSWKCAIAQVRCFKNGKTRNVLSLIFLEIYRVVDVMHGI
jgi:hypothetical protein